MKKVILVIAVILTASAAGFSQNADSPAVMYRLDSIIIEREGLPSSKETYLYNEYGKEILTTHFSWNETNNEWDENGKIEYVYDTNKNLITEISTWKTKEEWIYDTNKNIATHIKSYWNDSINNWEEHEKYEYVYNANNKLSQVQSQDFFFRIKWKVEHQYNDNGETITEISYEENMLDRVCKEKYKRESVYDTNGNEMK